MSRVFTQQEILETLDRIGIAYSISGDPAKNAYAFKSLRAPEPGGIFYLEGDAHPAGRVDHSLFLAQQPIDAPTVGTIIVDHPKVVFYRLMREYFDTRDQDRGVHPTAIVSRDAVIHPDAWVGPYCVIGDADIGARSRLHSHVTVFDDVTIEQDVVIEPNSAIGATGVAWAWDPTTRTRVVQPQIGGVRIGASCFIGSDVSVVRGSVNEVTTIGAGTVVAHGTKFGHGCRVGQNSHFANNISLGGNVDLGARCFLGSGSVVRPSVTLADDTIVGAGAVVTKDYDEVGLLLVGVPARPQRRRHSHLSGVPRQLE